MTHFKGKLIQLKKLNGFSSTAKKCYSFFSSFGRRHSIRSETSLCKGHTFFPWSFGLMRVIDDCCSDTFIDDPNNPLVFFFYITIVEISLLLQSNVRPSSLKNRKLPKWYEVLNSNIYTNSNSSIGFARCIREYANSVAVYDFLVFSVIRFR